jgi:hypothetical protein
VLESKRWAHVATFATPGAPGLLALDDHGVLRAADVGTGSDLTSTGPTVQPRPAFRSERTASHGGHRGRKASGLPIRATGLLRSSIAPTPARETSPKRRSTFTHSDRF